MGFFKEFKKNYKKISKVASKLTPQNKPAKTTTTVSSYDPKEDPDEFYYRFERTIDNWEERIDDTMEWDDNPNVTVKNYEKALQKCDKFKEWCYSKGEVGEKYYAQEGKRFHFLPRPRKKPVLKIRMPAHLLHDGRLSRRKDLSRDACAGRVGKAGDRLVQGQGQVQQTAAGILDDDVRPFKT